MILEEKSCVFRVNKKAFRLRQADYIRLWIERCHIISQYGSTVKGGNGFLLKQLQYNPGLSGVLQPNALSWFQQVNFIKGSIHCFHVWWGPHWVGALGSNNPQWDDCKLMVCRGSGMKRERRCRGWLLRYRNSEQGPGATLMVRAVTEPKPQREVWGWIWTFLLPPISLWWTVKVVTAFL